MIKIKNIMVKTPIPRAKVCDMCKKEYKASDIEEFDEFLHIRTTGGYGSIFEDGVTIECDLCQHCVKSLLGYYLRFKSSK